MSVEACALLTVNRWRMGGRRLFQLAILAVVAINGLVVLARSAAKNAGRGRRESREWYALYRNVMVNQQQQSWIPLQSDPMGALRSSDIWCAIRATETVKNRI